MAGTAATRSVPAMMPAPARPSMCPGQSLATTVPQASGAETSETASCNADA